MINKNQYYDMRMGDMKNNCPYKRTYWLIPWALCIKDKTVHSCIASNASNCDYLYNQAIAEGLEEKVMLDDTTK